MSSEPAGDHEIAAAALGLLTATYADSDRFGEVTLDYLAAMGSDTGKVIRLATGLTAVARVLIGMRGIETGASPGETLEEIGRRLRLLYPDCE